MNLIIPAGDPWQKRGRVVASPEQRLEMARLAVDGVDGLEVSDLEVRRGTASVTADTLEDLAAPDRELYLILGADAVANMGTWRRLDDTRDLATIVVVERDGEWFLGDEPVNREYGKMGKSLRNVVTPDDIYTEYGADTLRLYEMFMGPLDASRPWNTTDIVGVHRFLQRLWRNLVDEDTGEVHIGADAADDDTRRLLHRTIEAVRSDMEGMSFNTAIARLFELNNHLTQVVAATGAAPREVAEGITLMVAPLAPHIAEELWARMGHADSLAYEAFPAADPTLLVVDAVEVPVQVNGKVRGRITVGVDADAAALEVAARADEKVAALLEGVTVRKVIAVPGRLVNFVVG